MCANKQFRHVTVLHGKEARLPTEARCCANEREVCASTELHHIGRRRVASRVGDRVGDHETLTVNSTDERVHSDHNKHSNVRSEENETVGVHVARGVVLSGVVWCGVLVTIGICRHCENCEMCAVFMWYCLLCDATLEHVIDISLHPVPRHRRFIESTKWRRVRPRNVTSNPRNGE